MTQSFKTKCPIEFALTPLNQDINQKINIKNPEFTLPTTCLRKIKRNTKKPPCVFLSAATKQARVRSSVRLEHRTFNPRVAGSIPVGPALNYV